MRLWSLHPKYLDTQGLVALWREALLARAVLRGETRGYKHHPQLERFAAHASPRLAINGYLAAVHAEALSRGYNFDGSKVGRVRVVPGIDVTSGQVNCKWQHLLRRLAARSPLIFAKCGDLAHPRCHPVFRSRPGPASWERLSDGF